MSYKFWNTYLLPISRISLGESVQFLVFKWTVADGVSLISSRIPTNRASVKAKNGTPYIPHSIFQDVALVDLLLFLIVLTEDAFDTSLLQFVGLQLTLGNPVGICENLRLQLELFELFGQIIKSD